MCCLFGIIDYKGRFSGRQKAKMLSILATECEARGTDATGIAYNSGGLLRIFKRPLPAHKLRFLFPDNIRTVMGHTRMTTQGSEKKNYNNHPFPGRAGRCSFALAHNGVLYNDVTLRKSAHLPNTRVETDSFVAVQLIEQKESLTFDSLRQMAEQLEGSFTITVLDEKDNLYFIKGDNPMCLLHFPKAGFYIYASTEEILGRALRQLYLPCETPEKVALNCGDILKIDRFGECERDGFDDSNLWYQYPSMGCYRYAPTTRTRSTAQEDYLTDVKSVAAAFGFTPGEIDHLLQHGFTLEEIEEYLYDGEM